MLRFSSRRSLGQEYKCKVKLLRPNEELECTFGPTHNGQYLMDYVAKTLDLADREYFGLKFANQIQWLDQTKSILKQTKGMDTIVFEFRVKFYPAEPASLPDEMTRYHIYLQLRLDLLEGRLHCQSDTDLAYIIACILQSELGDHDTKKHIPNYVSNFKFVPNQTEELENTAARIHQSEDIRGLPSAEAELNLLKKASPLDTYGIDPYPVKEGHSQNHYIIGINHTGILTFQDSKKMHHFKWSDIHKITLDNKVVIIHCNKYDQNNKKKSNTMFGFKCPTHTSCHNLWKIATEHRYFFTMESSEEVPTVTNAGGLAFFNRTCRLRYTGKVEKELLRNSSDTLGRGNTIKRSTSLVMRSSEPPRWSGFQQGSSDKFRPLSSLEESFGSRDMHPLANMTLPASFDYLESTNNNIRPNDLSRPDSKLDESSEKFVAKPSISPTLNRSTKTASNRLRNSKKLIEKPQLQPSPTSSKGQASDAETTYKLIKAFFFISTLLTLFILVVLIMINEYDHPTFIPFRREPSMIQFRNNIYLPVKTALHLTLSNVTDILDKTYF